MTVKGSRANAGANAAAVAPANLARPSSNVRDTVVMSATSPTPFQFGPSIFLDRMTPELPTAVTRKADFHPQPASYNWPALSRNGLTE
jgi:hypothetical protein